MLCFGTGQGSTQEDCGEGRASPMSTEAGQGCGAPLGSPVTYEAVDRSEKGTKGMRVERLGIGHVAMVMLVTRPRRGWKVAKNPEGRK